MLLIAAGLLVVAVMLFRVPLASVFSIGILLVCPLLMIGMHGSGHGAGHDAASHGRDAEPDHGGDGG